MDRIVINGITYELDRETGEIFVLADDGTRAAKADEGVVTAADFLTKPEQLAEPLEVVSGDMPETEMLAEIERCKAEAEWLEAQVATPNIAARLIELTDWRNRLATAVNQIRSAVPEVVEVIDVPKPEAKTPAPKPEPDAKPDETPKSETVVPDEIVKDGERIPVLAAEKPPAMPNPIPDRPKSAMGEPSFGFADMFPQGRNRAIFAEEASEGTLARNDATDTVIRRLGQFHNPSQTIGKSRTEGVVLMVDDPMRGAINPVTGQPIQTLRTVGNATADQNELTMKQQAQAMAVYAEECGWHCATPNRDETIAELCSRGGRPISSMARPPQPIGQGKYSFRAPMDLMSITNFDIHSWTPEDQANVDPADPSTWKNDCATLPEKCLDDIVMSAQVLYWCFKFSTFDQISRPDEIERVQQIMSILLDRKAEQKMLDFIDISAAAWPNGAVLSHAAGDSGLGIAAELQRMFVGLATNHYQPLRLSALRGQTMIIGEDLSMKLRLDAALAGEVSDMGFNGEAVIANWLNGWASALGLAGVIITPDYGTAEMEADMVYDHEGVFNDDTKLKEAYEACPIDGDGAVPAFGSGEPVPGIAQNHIIRFVDMAGIQPFEQIIRPYQGYTDSALIRQNCWLNFGEVAWGALYRGCTPPIRVDVSGACATGARPDRVAIDCEKIHDVPALRS